MNIGILGPLEIDDHGTPVEITGPKQRSLLALLVVNDGYTLSSRQILDELWPETTSKNPRKLLQVHISKLRDGLGPLSRRIVTDRTGYMIDLGRGEIDATRFEDLVERARALLAVDADEATYLLDQAIDLWRGPALEGIDDGFARIEATRLDELRLGALEDRFEAGLRSGRAADLIGDLRAAVAQHPLRERLRGQLMLALYQSGQQAEALRAFSDARQALGSQLGIEPSLELAELEEQILLHDPGLRPGREARKVEHNLPARLDSVVGREATLHALAELIGEQRLVTLTGVGGVGKTTLGIELARGVMGRYPNGVWLVELAAVRDASGVATALATVLGIPDSPHQALEDVVVDSLRAREILIVLDNCEHLVDACARLVDRLLRFCDGVAALATSRMPLGVPGELVWKVSPLETPRAASRPTVAELVSNASVRLFMDRARETTPGFLIRPAEAEAVGEICRTVDGIPLAVEMAAARTVSETSPKILNRLKSSFDGVLESRLRTVDPRQRTMLATIQWSYDLLGEDARQIFNRLGVFPGSFSAEAAEQICEAEGRELESLVSASLLRVESLSPLRYRLLEPVREFAVSRLIEDGESPEMSARHLEYFAAFGCEALHHQRAGSQSKPVSDVESERWRTAIADDLPNLLAALDRAIGEREIGMALEIVVPLGGFWYRELRINDALDVLQSVLDHEECPIGEMNYFGLCRLGQLQANTGDGAAADKTLTAAQDVADRLDKPVSRSGLLVARSDAALVRGDVVTAVGYLEESLRLADESGHPAVRAYVYNLAYTLPLIGEFGRAAELTDRLAMGDAEESWFISNLRGRSEAHDGQFEEAVRHFREAIGAAPDPWNRLRNQRHLSYALINLGDLTQAREIGVALEPEFRNGWMYEAEQRTNLSLGLIELRTGTRVEAHERFRNGVSRAHERRDRFMLWTALFAVAEWHAAGEDWATAARLLGHCAALSAKHQYSVRALDCVPAVSLDEIAEHLGRAATERLASEGAGVTTDVLVSEFLRGESR